MAVKTNLVVSYTDPDGKAVKKAVTNINAGVDEDAYIAFAQGLISLTDNTYNGAAQVNTADVGGTKPSHPFSVTWNGTTYNSETTSDSDGVTLHVKSTDSGVVNLGNSRYLVDVVLTTDYPDDVQSDGWVAVSGPYGGYYIEGATGENPIRHLFAIFDTSRPTTGTAAEDYYNDGEFWIEIDRYHSINTKFTYVVIYFEEVS